MSNNYLFAYEWSSFGLNNFFFNSISFTDLITLILYLFLVTGLYKVNLAVITSTRDSVGMALHIKLSSSKGSRGHILFLLGLKSAQ